MRIKKQKLMMNFMKNLKIISLLSLFVISCKTDIYKSRENSIKISINKIEFHHYIEWDSKHNNSISIPVWLINDSDVAISLEKFFLDEQKKSFVFKSLKDTEKKSNLYLIEKEKEKEKIQPGDSIDLKFSLQLNLNVSTLKEGYDVFLKKYEQGFIIAHAELKDVTSFEISNFKDLKTEFYIDLEKISKEDSLKMNYSVNQSLKLIHFPDSR